MCDFHLFHAVDASVLVLHKLKHSTAFGDTLTVHTHTKHVHGECQYEKDWEGIRMTNARTMRHRIAGCM